MPPRLAYPPAPGQARPRARGLMCGRRVPAKPAPGSSPCTYPAPTLHLAPRGGLCWLGLPCRPPRGRRAPTPHLPCTWEPGGRPRTGCLPGTYPAPHAQPTRPGPRCLQTSREPPAPSHQLPPRRAAESHRHHRASYPAPRPLGALAGASAGPANRTSLSPLSLSDAPVRPAFVGASSRWEI